jgi:hypothetical protein
MEGIRDGRAIDHCFYCALLYPDLPECPRCQGKLRYEPAIMMDAREAQEKLGQLWHALGRAPNPELAEQILVLVHQLEDEPLTAVTEAQLAQLRALVQPCH